MQHRAANKIVSLRGSHPGGVAAATPRPGQLLAQCRDMTTVCLKRLIRIMMENIDDALFELADKAGSNAEQNMYFDAMREVRLKRTVMESEFNTQVVRPFDQFLEGGTATTQSLPESDEEMELGLVDPDALEERLAIEGMVSKARSRNQEELRALKKRLEAVTKRGAIEPDVNPVDPSPICHAFESAAQVLDSEIKVKLIIYKLFEKFVVGELNALYVDINQVFAEAGIEYDASQHYKRSTPSAGVSPRAPERGESRRREFAVADTEAGSEATELLRLLAQAVATRPGIKPVGQSGGVGVAASADVVGALSRLQSDQALAVGSTQSASELKAAILDLVRKSSGQDGVHGMAQAENSVIDIVSMLFDFIFDDPSLPPQVTALIGRLQIPVLKVAILDQDFFSQRNHPARRLLNELARTGVGWSEASDEESRDLLEHIERSVTTVLEQFETDPQVFARVLEEFSGYIAEQRAQAQHRAEAAARAEEDRENLTLAKLIAGQAVDKLLAEASVPDDIKKFLHGTWNRLLVAVYVKYGSESKAWERAINVASTLVWSLAPKHTQQQRDQLLAMLPRLLKAVRDCMDRMGCSEQERTSVLSRLAAEHAKLVREPHGDEINEARGQVLRCEMGERAELDEATLASDDSPAEEVIGEPVSARGAGAETDGKSFIARKVEEIDRVIAEGKFQLYQETLMEGNDSSAPCHEGSEDGYVVASREMPEGTWLEVSDDNDKGLRVKLSWKSLITGKYFFVSRNGLKVREMTVYQLAAELRDGRARVLDDGPLIDRAINRMMSAIPG